MIEFSPSGSSETWELLPVDIPSDGEITEVFDLEPDRIEKVIGFYRVRVKQTSN